MDLNPYESPRETSNKISNRNFFGLRRKPWWGYIIAFVVGLFGGAIVLTPILADLDDTGGIEMMIGGFLGAAIYGLLFPLSSSPKP